MVAAVMEEEEEETVAAAMGEEVAAIERRREEEGLGVKGEEEWRKKIRLNLHICPHLNLNQSGVIRGKIDISICNEKKLSHDKHVIRQNRKIR